ncbi:MAG TPA: hypothetical protein VIJ51_11280 [Solirubrobacteraceae bacterium]
MTTDTPSNPALDLPLAFHPLSFVPEGPDVLVGRPASDSYAVLPSDGAELLNRMTGGMSPADAAAWYEATYGQTLDIHDFIVTLADLGFLRQDGQDPVPAAAPVGLQRLAAVVFSVPAFVLYAAVLLGYLASVLADPQLAPNPKHIFVTDSLALVELLVVFGQLPWLALHEAAHVLAGRRVGLPSRLGFGTRLYFVVFETRMPSLLSVPRRQRYLAFVAGMLLDVVAISGLGLLAYATHLAGGRWNTLGAVALAMAFPICTRFAYQFLLFLETDVYYVVATALGCYDLHAATKAIVANRIWRVLRRPDRIQSLDAWTDQDRRVARSYAPFFAAGVAVIITVGVFAIIPVLTEIARLARVALAQGSSSPRFWDAVVFISLNLAQFSFLAYLSCRTRLQVRSKARTTTPSLRGELS